MSNSTRAPMRWALPEVRWAAVSVVLFAVGGLLQFADAPVATWWAAYLLCYATGGWEPSLTGLRALREKTLDVDLLMVVAAIVAAAIGQVLDGALLIIIFATSGALEAVATQRTRDSVTALLDLAPEQASRADGTIVATAQLQVGDVIRVRPGERIGADGVVVDGSSDVDQASITGEPLPSVKHPGAEVFAGTMNGTGALLVRVTRRADESVVARIAAMVEEASATKARTQLFIDGIEQKYSIGMVTATLLLFLVPLLFGAPLQSTLLRAITFMIVASPCAVVLATMPPLLSAIANAGRHGVLVKSAVVMEQLALTDTVAFDKTGTLTEGAPRVSDVRPAAGWTADRLLTVAAAAELPSQHPLAGAVVAAAAGPLPRAADFSSVPGRGVRARVDGRLVEIGAADESTPSVDGDTAVAVLVDGALAGTIGFVDRTRVDAADAVRTLSALTSYPPLLLTGDNASAARRLGDALGIGDIRAGLLPQHKVAAVEQLRGDGRRVLVVGDGVNDAPAMAAAHLGVAMGRRGSDLALETADAVVVHDELAAIGSVISLARRARRVVTANLVIASAVITALVLWDLFGRLPLPLGVAGHEGSTVIVGLNGLRLLRRASWPTPVTSSRQPADAIQHGDCVGG